jgi:hypothetical protein
MSPDKHVQGLSVSDTPWFWLMLFSLAALAAIATIGPKFERREQSIETKFHARERGLHREAVEQPADDAPGELPEWNPIFTLGPIAAVIGVVAIVSLMGVVRFHRRRLLDLRNSEHAKPQADRAQPATDN